MAKVGLPTWEVGSEKQGMDALAKRVHYAR